MGAASDGPVARLPAVLPIFPLWSVLLLPRGHLPLHVFEPRYRAMTAAALREDRMIGMMQPRECGEGPLADTVPLYDIGCVGRIISFSEVEDGRYYLTLRGICRFRIAEELPMREGFRQIRPDFAPFLEDFREPAAVPVDRDRLLGAFRGYIDAKKVEADWDTIGRVSVVDLVLALSMMLPFDPREKQALLECADDAARAELLQTLLEMASREGVGFAGGVLQ